MVLGSAALMGGEGAGWGATLYEGYEARVKLQNKTQSFVQCGLM